MGIYFLIGWTIFSELLKTVWMVVSFLSVTLVFMASLFFFSHYGLKITERPDYLAKHIFKEGRSEPSDANLAQEKLKDRVFESLAVD
jgi:hypothetical protein